MCREVQTHDVMTHSLLCGPMGPHSFKTYLHSQEEPKLDVSLCIFGPIKSICLFGRTIL